MFEPIYETTRDAIIKVVGVGGGGGNALNHMIESVQDSEGANGVEFYSVNTDAQALRNSAIRQTIQIGANTTKGLGAGANPNVGRQAAEEDREALSNMLDGADMVFISAGMGGGTGTGAAPVVAEIAKSLERPALTVAVVTKPFKFEGPRRMNYAEQGIQELSKYVDSLIIIPNDKLLKVLPKNTKMLDAFAAANNVLRNAVFGITDMITNPGLVNVDFADVHTVMSEMGRAMMGTGIHEGEGRAERAVQDAVASPLLEDVDLSGARGILVSITSGLDLEMQEVETIMEHIYGFASPDAAIVFGTAINPEMEGKLRVTLVATGLGQAEELKMPRTSFQSVQTVQQPVQQMAGGQYQPQQQQPQAPSFAQPQQLAQPQQSFVSPEPQQTTPRQVDSAQMFSPSSIPGFLQKGQ